MTGVKGAREIRRGIKGGWKKRADILDGKYVFGDGPAAVCALGVSIIPLAVTVLTLYCPSVYEPLFFILAERTFNVHIFLGLP